MRVSVSVSIARSVALAGMLLACVLNGDALAAKDDAKARAQFEQIVAAINEKNFEPIKTAVDKTDMINRVLSARPIAVEAQDAFRANFWEAIESTAMSGMPAAKGELIDFRFTDGQGRAVVRYLLPSYFYVYQIWTLRHDGRGRLRVVDWRNPGVVDSFVEEINAGLVVAMPSREVARQVLNMQSASDGDLFQAAELLKAIRDQQPERFFEIYDQLELSVRKQFLIAEGAIEFSLGMSDTNRLMQALELFTNTYGGDPKYALAISNTFFLMDDYSRAFDLMALYHQYADVKEGSIPARLSALALVLGKTEEAESYAVEATENEPAFELGWWSMLRARARAGDFEGALVPMAHLEDHFNKRMDGAKLRRDQFGAFIKLAESDEFQKWRATRP